MIVLRNLFIYILPSLILLFHQTECAPLFPQPNIFLHENIFSELDQFKQKYSGKFKDNATRQNIPTTIEQAKQIMADIVKQYMTDYSIPGLVIGLSIRGETIWTEAFGFKDIENNVPATVDDVWSLASISKPLTSTLIARLAMDGMVDVNAPITQYLPSDVFPQKKFNGIPVTITLGHVLSHMAGLWPAEFPEDFFFDAEVYKALNCTESVVRYKDEPLIFAPGTSFTYSNYGYQVAGALLEAILGNTFPNLIREYYGNILGMSSTFAETLALFNNRPMYYQNSTGQLKRHDIIDNLVLYEGWWPSAGMVSTVDDLLYFGNLWLSSYKGLNDSNIDLITNLLFFLTEIIFKDFLSEEIVREWWTPRALTEPISGAQAYGMLSP